MFFVTALIGLRKISEKFSDEPVHAPATVNFPNVAYLAPVVLLNVDPQAKETAWSALLAEELNGSTEAPVQNGRVDVLTDTYAIEVERLKKWHEGIGQASHYSIETGKVACLAIIIEPQDIPLSESTLKKLLLIEKIALASSIKLLFLLPAKSETQLSLQAGSATLRL